MGLLSTRRGDDKVRRWALIALADVGKPDTCRHVIGDILKDFSNDVLTAAAAVATLRKLERTQEKLQALNGVDPQVQTLATLQYHDNQPQLSIEIDQAEPDILKLAFLVVGFDRAPPNLFHPRHGNADIVGVLGSHHDSGVSQYSVWAIAENDNLNLENLGIPLRSIENQPSNVRGWMFRLIAADTRTAQAHREYIELGASDPEGEARFGLAFGMRDTYYDGLEPLALDWLSVETDPETQSALIDHVVRQSGRAPDYRAAALEVYQRFGPDTLERQRMEYNAHAAGLPIFQEFRKIAYDGYSDLFRGPTIMTNNTTIHGSVQGGAISIGGNATNSGTSNVAFTPLVIETIRSELTKGTYEIQQLDLDQGAKEAALERLAAAHADPTPSKISVAVESLQKIESGSRSLVKIGQAAASLAPIIHNLGRAAGLW